jgi:hypothetical protein
MDVAIVFGSAAFGMAFVLAWLLRPDLRAWLEQPKHRFDADVRRYDERSETGGSERQDPPSGYRR